VTVGAAVQAAAFGPAPRDSLVATEAVRNLARYRVMHSVEVVDGRSLTATCVQGSFRAGVRGRLVTGALVLLGNGERLYDAGRGVRRLLRFGRSRAAGRVDRRRFILAACPHYLGGHFASELIRGRPVEAVDERSDGTKVAGLIARSRHATLTLDVTRLTFEPLALSLREGRFRGSSDLVPGGTEAAMRRIRHAFNPESRRERSRA
jgi:hypothetical protein